MGPPRRRSCFLSIAVSLLVASCCSSRVIGLINVGLLIHPPIGYRDIGDKRQTMKLSAITSETVLCCLVSASFSYMLARQPWRDHGISVEKTDDMKETISSDKSPTPGRPTRRTLEEEMQENGGTISVRPIGVIRSIYRLCVGTPRQGGLAPDARGRLQLQGDPPMVQGLEDFSYVWITFVFHLNLVGKRCPTKISPPALGGRKVGVLATRSPHRPNPIGISLVQLDSIETATVRVKGRPKQVTILNLRGLDLVDGTPVLDVKPYVGTYDGPLNYRVPTWVSGGLDQQRTVEITPEARQELQAIFHDHDLEFYDSIDSVLRCIVQVLAIDVRSGFKTKKARRQDERATSSTRLAKSEDLDSVEDVGYTQQLDNLLLHIKTAAPTQTSIREASVASGAEDHAVVTKIEWLGNQYI